MATIDKKALKQQEKEAKRAKREATKQRWKQVWQAFQMQRKEDKALLPIMAAAFFGIIAVFVLFGYLVWGGWTMAIPGIAFGLLAAMWVFTKRLQNTVYKRAEGQAGAAGWALQNMRSGVGMVWNTKNSVAVTTHMDAVHRVIGNCGIVLVGEGSEHRVRPLMAQQRKRFARVAPTTPVYELMAGDGEDQIPVKKLQRELMKLPREMKKDETYNLIARIESIDNTLPGGQAGLPKGPIPKGANLSGMNRRARRTQARQKRG
ncbi:DUF4191 domain-containing protein [Corynebacterium mendelii]|uniref:DUF4191 domain-containing protein n=1 Tax=Corynebacterium mendelii TaxID=2765362 RepID=A0A939DYB8_9CORY|nr:DUF4191 domain-containing protein [Corynebacterium mendelii]MBN9643050.1 DUF4191 domain-containing protein [Corynebacterium mendelii]